MKTRKHILTHLKSNFAYIIIILIAFSITSCENNFYAVSKLYVKNNVDKKIMILVDYPGSSSDSTTAYFNPDEGLKLIAKFQDENYERFCGKNTNRKIYIYNMTDSTYYQVQSSDFDADPEPSFVNTTNSEEMDNKEQTVTYDYYITVNDSLIAKMHKIRS